MDKSKPTIWLKLYASLMGFLFGMRAFFTKQRATHAIGKTVYGQIQLDGEETTRIGLPNTLVNVDIRFSNLNSDDDLGLDVRGMAIKCKNIRLDLAMNTGPTLLFWNAVTLLKFTLYNALGNYFLKRYYTRYPKALDNLKAAAKRAPKSYTDLSYYSQIPIMLQTQEGEKLARFRFIPNNISQHHTSQQFHRKNLWWDTARTADVIGSKDFLRNQLINDCALNKKMVFQISYAANNKTNYDPSLEWPETTSPWITLGVLNLNGISNTSLSPVDNERLPQWWSILRANELSDINLMSEIRANIYKRSRQARK